MKRGILILALTASFGVAQAQNDKSASQELKNELKAELAAGATSSRTVRVKSAPVAIRNDVVVEVPDQSSEDRGVYQQTAPTVVEDTPLRESRADQLRKKRTDLETRTEEKIVEQLEDDRMKAEEERASRVTSGLVVKKSEPQVEPETTTSAFESIDSYPQAKGRSAVVAPAPVVYEEPAAAAPSLKEELATLKAADEPKTRFYLGAQGGIGDYPGVKNVKGAYGYGITGGLIFPDRLVFELGVSVSSYDIEKMNYPSFYPMITVMDQYNVTGGLKYKIIENRVTPVVGALASYTYRSYDDKQFGYSYNQASSQALDMGLLGGVDVKLGDNFEVGADLRYFFNLTYRTDNRFQSSFLNPVPGTLPVEKANYYLFSLVGRFTF